MIIMISYNRISYNLNPKKIMSLEIVEKIGEEKRVRGEVHFGEHTVMQPTHYLLFTGSFRGDLRGGLFVNAEQLIRSIVSLPHDRSIKRDLRHFFGRDELYQPTTLVCNAIEWNPRKHHVLNIGSIPFTVSTLKNFLDWFRYTTKPQWVDGFYGTPSSRPFTFTSEEKQGFEDFREFLATLPQGDKNYWNVYEIECSPLNF